MSITMRRFLNLRHELLGRCPRNRRQEPPRFLFARGPKRRVFRKFKRLSYRPKNQERAYYNRIAVRQKLNDGGICFRLWGSVRFYFFSLLHPMFAVVTTNFFLLILSMGLAEMIFSFAEVAIQAIHRIAGTYDESVRTVLETGKSSGQRIPRPSPVSSREDMVAYLIEHGAQLDELNKSEE